jgi:hypothetical protein
VRAAIAIAPVALLATSCGGKSDPYAASLAKGSEHVEASGAVNPNGTWVEFTESGDFTNNPDRGRITLRIDGHSYAQIVTPRYVYWHPHGAWTRIPLTGGNVSPQTPAQIFRARPKATIAGGLVRHVDVRTSTVRMSVDFSKYGEPVSVTIPRVKGSK